VNGFYEYELAQRRRLGYPPFTRLVRLEYRDQDQEAAEREAGRVAERLEDTLKADRWKNVSLIGPVPCFFSKMGGYYRWQIVLRGANPQEVMRDVRLDGWRVEVEPISLL
jgi:primosomal protein N' (replication factor Y)